MVKYWYKVNIYKKMFFRQELNVNHSVHSCVYSEAFILESSVAK